MEYSEIKVQDATKKLMCINAMLDDVYSELIEYYEQNIEDDDKKRSDYGIYQRVKFSEETEKAIAPIRNLVHNLLIDNVKANIKDSVSMI